MTKRIKAQAQKDVNLDDDTDEDDDSDEDEDSEEEVKGTVAQAEETKDSETMNDDQLGFVDAKGDGNEDSDDDGTGINGALDSDTDDDEAVDKFSNVSSINSDDLFPSA